jgi:Bifunctional DNA primase/polymerase, N-terminal
VPDIKHSGPWWTGEVYVDDEPMPSAFTGYAGPKGMALVRAWPNGLTDKGWGSDFMEHYARGEFNGRRILYGYERGKWAFAFVMRSVSMVCIDIDGKNGGVDGAKKLGALPVTLAETSKSGDGYHLFYLVDDQWDDRAGYARFADRIGLEQGVDIRATGCVYHHAQQRWNGQPAVRLPDHLAQMLTAREQKQLATSARIAKVLAINDETEVLLMRDQLFLDLAKPIDKGKRNNTLFAIGNQMREAEIEDWDKHVYDRALAVGLDMDEADKLVRNIERYGSANATNP